MRYETLSLAHKDMLYGRLKQAHTPLSEYSFANLYLFRTVHNYQLLFDKEIFIKGRTYDGFTHLMPAAGLKNIEYNYIKDISTEADFLFPIPEQWLEFFKPADFDISSKQDDADYIYLTEKLSTYKGNKLHGKRNLLMQFVTNYQCRTKPLIPDTAKDAKDILQAWQKEAGGLPEQTDYHPCLEALQLYDDLSLCGIIYYIQDEPAGFVIGEELSKEYFVLHFVKAKRKFKGIYQYMYNNFANMLPEKYKYINLEEDLGKPALRLAKSSYAPDAMLKKYRVKIKK